MQRGKSKKRARNWKPTSARRQRNVQTLRNTFMDVHRSLRLYAVHCRLAKRLKEAIARSQQGADAVGEVHSEAGSDGAWEMLHQEVLVWITWTCMEMDALSRRRPACGLHHCQHA